MHLTRSSFVFLYFICTIVLNMNTDIEQLLTLLFFSFLPWCYFKNIYFLNALEYNVAVFFPTIKSGKVYLDQFRYTFYVMLR